jgi:DNA-binding transcriptional MerR regulator
MKNGITISQAAAFAGVTVKTIRHYHRNGLIEEPPRDSSGYRRYGSNELLRLVQARTLAGAGVPLAEVAGILDAEPEEFTAALVEVEKDLDSRIDELVARREMLRRLAQGERVLLPDRACALLERLAEVGFTEDDVTIARDALVLVRALVPEGLDDYLNQIEAGLADPRYVTLMKLNMRAGDLEPDDPRVEETAMALADHFIAHPELLPTLTGLRSRDDGELRRELLSHHAEDEKPAWARMTELIEERLRAAGIALP